MIVSVILQHTIYYNKYIDITFIQLAKQLFLTLSIQEIRQNLFILYLYSYIIMLSITLFSIFDN